MEWANSAQRRTYKRHQCWRCNDIPDQCVFPCCDWIFSIRWNRGYDRCNWQEVGLWRKDGTNREKGLVRGCSPAVYNRLAPIQTDKWDKKKKATHQTTHIQLTCCACTGYCNTTSSSPRRERNKNIVCVFSTFILPTAKINSSKKLAQGIIYISSILILHTSGEKTLHSVHKCCHCNLLTAIIMVRLKLIWIARVRQEGEGYSPTGPSPRLIRKSALLLHSVHLWFMQMSPVCWRCLVMRV